MTPEDLSSRPFATGTGGRALILVVDRNPAVRELERFLLEQAGYSVEFASDGQDAYEKAHEEQPYLLVTEILVPRLDGLTLCRKLRADPATRAIRIIVFSHLDAEDRSLEAGADAFIGKPFSAEKLIGAVQSLIDGMKRAE
jgi:CheY-like chemotaxis protein